MFVPELGRRRRRRRGQDSAEGRPPTVPTDGPSSGPSVWPPNLGQAFTNGAAFPGFTQYKGPQHTPTRLPHGGHGQHEQEREPERMGGPGGCWCSDRELKALATNRPSPPRDHPPLPALRRELEEEEKERATAPVCSGEVSWVTLMQDLPTPPSGLCHRLWSPAVQPQAHCWGLSSACPHPSAVLPRRH